MAEDGFRLYKWETKMKESLLSLLLALGLSGTQCGCVSTLNGAGKSGLAYDSTFRVYSFHEADGDKQENESRAELNLEPLVDLILKYKSAEEGSDPKDGKPKDEG